MTERLRARNSRASAWGTALLPLFLLAAAGALLVALWAGLFRAGWERAAQLLAHHPMAHGPLMLCGFLGTVIALEKAKGLGAGWAWCAPLASALGAVALVIGADTRIPALAFAAAAAGLCAMAMAILRRHADAANALILAGALAWLIGNLLWLDGRSIPQVVSWWIAFPVLIIVGERLELTRVLPRPRWALPALLVTTGLYATGLALLPASPHTAFRLQGLAWLLIALWLLRHDLARRTVRAAGVHRYTALCLLLGFGWLAVAGALLAVWGLNLLGLRYDAMTHAVLLGFVIGMIFGHAPIIAPMLLGRRLHFDGSLYAPLLLLQASLLLRLASSLVTWLPGRAWSAALNVAAMLLFLAMVARAFRAGEPIAAAPDG